MCGQCYELAGWDNHHNDNGSTPTASEMREYTRLLDQIGERGGDTERVKALNDYIWTE